MSSNETRSLRVGDRVQWHFRDGNTKAGAVRWLGEELLEVRWDVGPTEHLAYGDCARMSLSRAEPQEAQS